MVFCVSNELAILDTVRQVLSYYNLELYAEAWGANTINKDSINRLSSPLVGRSAAYDSRASKQSEKGNNTALELRADARTRALFSQVCLEILIHLLENLPKSQSFQTKQYYELVAPILHRHSARIQDCGSLEVFGLS